jgi:twitching motility protein PilT
VKDRVPSLQELGLPPVLLELAEARNGIVFVTGSTGAGKSTTLACMIEHINTVRPCHIVTIEDPIEYYFEDRAAILQQREVGLDTVTFESGLRHALRQDPDVIVIGELRSRDSFESALAAAETGHLVLTTLHTTNAAQSINRILDFYDFAERDAVRANLAANLRAIVCQRLVPTASGGGLVPINEVMLNTPTVRKIIIENVLNKLHTAISAGLQEGMQTFNHALLQLVQEGAITEETAFAFASNPDALRMNMQGIFLNEDARIVNV